MCGEGGDSSNQPVCISHAAFGILVMCSKGRLHMSTVQIMYPDAVLSVYLQPQMGLQQFPGHSDNLWNDGGALTGIHTIQHCKGSHTLAHTTATAKCCIQSSTACCSVSHQKSRRIHDMHPNSFTFHVCFEFLSMVMYGSYLGKSAVQTWPNPASVAATAGL